MTEPALDDVIARRFLLGQLPPEEQDRIQELAFEDPDTFVFLESVEDDLIDEFYNGELSDDEQCSFESYFLSQPGRRHDLKINRIIKRHFDSISPHVFPAKPPPRSVWVWISIAAAVVIAIVVGLFYLINQARQPDAVQAGTDEPTAIPNPQFTVSPSLQPTESPAHVQNKPKSLSPKKQKSLAPYALLSPSSLSRGEGVQQLKLTPDASTMTIELALITQSNFRSYEAVLKNEAGNELFSWPDLKIERLKTGKALKIDLAPALLKPQEFYRIAVSGVNSDGKKEEIAQYPFEVKE